MKSKLIMTFLFFGVNSLLNVFSTQAQDSSGTIGNSVSGIGVFYLSLFILFLVLIVLVAILLVFVAMLRNRDAETSKENIAEEESQSLLGYIWNKINGFDKSVKLDELKKEEIHEYDGIIELDNNLPPWWLALFYITIIFGVVYFFYYHVSDLGQSAAYEYIEEMEIEEKKVKEYIASLPPSVTEENAKIDDSSKALSGGKTIFTKNCTVCHGQLGEGGIGPNLTDKFWINGGDISSVFKIIKYGKIEKGMTAWEKKLSPIEIQNVASFVLVSLKGSKPPNPKAPQGVEN